MSDDAGGADRSQSVAGQIDAVCEAFERAWESGHVPRIEDHLAESKSRGPLPLRDLLVELVMIDLERRWRTARGSTLASKSPYEETGGLSQGLPEFPRLEDYVARYLELGPLDRLPGKAIEQEYRVRCRFGDAPGHGQYLQRFPGRGDSLRRILAEVDEDLAAQAAEARRGRSGDSSKARSSTPITLDQFVDNLSRSGLMPPEEVASLRSSLTPEEKPGDGHTLAQRLVAAGKLTAYQAEVICRGETRALAFDEYKVLDRIGEGGMGQVLKAEHRTMRRLVALKMISPKFMDSAEAVKRFHREVRAAAKLEHPNIVTAYDAREHEGVHYLVMQYVDGQDLGKVVKQRGPLPIPEAVDYVIQAARGLEYAHQQGIVHRDIKPGNMLLASPLSSRGRGAGGEGAKGVVKILDMGLARLDEPSAEDEPDSDQLTGSSQMMGTCDYMAPEQALDTHGADHRADIYSLGCTLYRFLTGKRPYSGMTPLQVLVAHREGPIPSLCEARDDVPGKLDAVFRKMVAKKPEERQQSMGEVIEELQECIGGDEDRPSDSALDAFLQDLRGSGVSVLRGGSGTGPTGAADTATTAGSEAGDEDAPPSQSPPAVPVARRLRPLWIVGGPVFAVTVLAGLVIVLVGGPGKKPVTTGTLVVDGPLGEVEVVARYEDDDLYRRLELDEQGRVDLKPGRYRFGLPRGHEKHQVVPDTITVAVGEQVAVRIEPKATVAPTAGTTVTRWQPGPSEDVLPGPSEDVLPGLIPRPAKLPGIKRWQVDTVAPRGPPKIDWSPDSKYLACGSYRQVRIYEVPSLKLTRILPQHGDVIQALAWSPDGEWLAVTDKEVVRLWDANTGRAGPVLRGHAESAISLAWSPDGRQLASGGNRGDRSIRIWDTSGNALQVMQEQTDVSALAWSPHAEWIVARLYNGRLTRWNAQTGQSEGEIDSSRPGTQPIAFSPDGKWFAAFKGGEGSRLNLWNATTWELDREFESIHCNSLSWSPQGTRIVAGEYGGGVSVYDLNGKLIHEIDHPEQYQTAVAWSPDGRWIASADPGVLGLLGLRLWDTEEQETLPGSFGRSREVLCVAWSPDGESIVSGSFDCTVRVLDRDGGLQKRVLRDHEREVTSVAWSPSGDRIASGADDGVRMWDLSSGGRETVLTERELNRVAFGPDGKSLAAAGWCKVAIWDVGQPKPRFSIEPSHDAPWVRWMPGTRWIAVGGSRGNAKVQLLDPASGTVEVIVDGCTDNGAFSSDGRWLATVRGNERKLRLLDSSTWELHRELAGVAFGDRYVAWSPDGRIVAACGGSPDIGLWNVDGTRLAPLEGDSEDIRAAEYHPTDSNLLVSGGNDGTIRLWNVGAGEQEWVTVLLPDDRAATFDAAGHLTSPNAAELDDALVYLTEQEDGSIELAKPTEFLARLATPSADYALQFDGESSCVNIELAHDVAQHPLTVEALVTPTAFPAEGTPSGVITMFGLGIWSTGMREWHSYVRSSFPDGHQTNARHGEVGLRSQHIAAVWDGAEVRFYVDGERRQDSLKGVGRIAKCEWVLIGHERGSGFFFGSIDEVRISGVARYDKDFTPQQRFEPDEHTIALYHFDEGQGDVLHDSSGNGHHGKIVGANWVKVELIPPGS